MDGLDQNPNSIRAIRFQHVASFEPSNIIPLRNYNQSIKSLYWDLCKSLLWQDQIDQERLDKLQTIQEIIHSHFECFANDFPFCNDRGKKIVGDSF